MTPKCVSILSDPHRCGHIVYPYTDEDHVAHAVALYASAGLKNGEAVILLMTQAHVGPIDHRLRAVGRLKAIFGEMIERARAVVAAPYNNGMVRAFGELVSLLWTDSVEAAARVEAYWDDLIRQYSISLLCAYALADARKSLPAALVNCHSHNLGAVHA